MTRSRLRSPFTTIRTEGALLPADLLQRVLAGDRDLDGLTPESYHLSGEKLNEAINRSWNRLQGAWAAFREAADKLPAGDPATTVTRERWLLPVCQELGYGRLVAAKALEIEGKSFAISHQWNDVPLHLVGAGIELDTRARGVAGAARSSPHSLVQEVLNRSESRLWGFVSNGLRWRVLRDNASLTRQAFVEFDLEAMFDGEVYADFAVFWLVGHQSRVEAERPEACWLEQWSRAAQQRGTRALETLRVGVEAAITALGGGFLAHPANVALRDRLRAGNLDKQDYYRQLLRLVYRLIFLFVAEDRELLLAPDADPAAKELYLRFYSTARLRRLAERLRGGRHADLYVALRLVMGKLGQGGSPELALPELGSFLWSPAAIPDLAGCELANADLLAAVRALAFTQEGRVRRAVDYRNLGPEELGSVYESLLELHPELNAGAATFALHTASGSERKTTSSYYTPSSLIKCLLDSALDPVIAEAMKQPDPEAALQALKVCDPACGSGHFLIAAAHRLARRLASVRSGETEPAPEVLRHALRDVIGRCLYGVDMNSMSVELCKVSLWMEALEPGRPLSFLDHHIQQGNSLIGATPALLARGIPDEAFTPIEGDDKKVCAEFKKRNKQERAGQMGFALDAERPAWERLGDLATAMLQLAAAPDDTPEAVHTIERQYAEIVRSAAYENGRLWADAWCAAFVWKKTREFAYPITETVFSRIERNPHDVAPWMRDEIRRLAGQYNFIHWHLAFPEVFRPLAGQPDADDVMGWEGGFDCVLGNPPWDMLQTEEQNFFETRLPEIARLPGATRKKAIAKLTAEGDPIAVAFAATRRIAEGQNTIVRYGGRFPLAARGKFNAYALFTELARHLGNERGFAGIIVPTGVATDDTTKELFGRIIVDRALVSLSDFENRLGLFPGVDSRQRFSLLTTSNRPVVDPRFVFYALAVEDTNDGRRYFSLSPDEISLLNPNTHTVPVFRSKPDAQLSLPIYRQWGVLHDEGAGHNSWGAHCRPGLLNVTSDSHLFHSERDNGRVPLYEGKMVGFYDHRAANVLPKSTTSMKRNDSIGTTESEYLDPAYMPQPLWWVAKTEIESRLTDWYHGWLLGFKDVTSATNERTAIFSLVPRVGIGHKVTLVFLDAATDARAYACFLGNANAIILDYFARQKVGGLSLGVFILRQLPFLPPQTYSPIDTSFVVGRIAELIYSAWDIKAFADDLWREADLATRDVLQHHWDENAAATGGHNWDPPAWAEITPDGCPLPPFKWDEDRRAVLRAELDAYYARLYGLNRKQLRYILDPHGLSQRELDDILNPWEDPTCAGPHLLPQKPALDFPGETFRVLKEKEERLYGEYRTRRLVLKAWDQMQALPTGGNG